MGERKQAVQALNRVLNSNEDMARTFALNSIDFVNGSADDFLDGCVSVLGNYEVLERQYDARIVKWLFEKWGVDPVSIGLEFTW